MRFVIPEVERCRLLTPGVDELHAVLLNEAALVHLRKHVEPLQHPVGLRDQGFADVKTREALAIEQLDAVSLLREGRRRGRSRRTAPTTTTSGLSQPIVCSRAHVSS